MADQDPVAPAPEVPAAAPSAPADAPAVAVTPVDGAQPVGQVDVVVQPAAPAAPAPEEHSPVMAQAEPEPQPDQPTPPPSDPSKELTPTPEETAILKVLEEKGYDANVSDLMKALEAGNFNAAPTELKQGCEFIVEDRQKDVPGSDPRCTP